VTKSNTAKQKVVYLDCQRYAAEAFDCAQAYWRIFKDGARWDAVEGSKAFALIWTVKEANALGKDTALASSDDPALAAELSLRLKQWQKAFLEWNLLVMRKENPAAFDETATQRARDAAELGVRLGDKTEKTTDRLIEFIKRRSELSEREHCVFLETAFDNKPADWRHPELDTFLMLMWPIVERFKWTYLDVLEAVQKKFSGQRGYPFDATYNLKKHCGGLGLHTANAPRTARPHPRGKAPLFELVQEMSTQPEILRRFGFLPA
jgi:hypothetical protein